MANGLTIWSVIEKLANIKTALVHSLFKKLTFINYIFYGKIFTSFKISK